MSGCIRGEKSKNQNSVHNMKREHILQSEKIAFYLKPYIYIYLYYIWYIYVLYTPTHMHTPGIISRVFSFLLLLNFMRHSSWKAAWSRGKN